MGSSSLNNSVYTFILDGKVFLKYRSTKRTAVNYQFTKFIKLTKAELLEAEKFKIPHLKPKGMNRKVAYVRYVDGFIIFLWGWPHSQKKTKILKIPGSRTLSNGFIGFWARVPQKRCLVHYYLDAFYIFNKIASWGSYISGFSVLIFPLVLVDVLLSKNNDNDRRFSHDQKVFLGTFFVIALWFLGFKFLAFIGLLYILFYIVFVDYPLIKKVLTYVEEVKVENKNMQMYVKKKYYAVYIGKIVSGVVFLICMVLNIFQTSSITSPNFVTYLTPYALSFFIVFTILDLILAYGYVYKKSTSIPIVTLTVSSTNKRLYHTTAEKNVVSKFVAATGTTYVGCHEVATNVIFDPNKYSNFFNVYAPTGISVYFRCRGDMFI